ncbi:shikimate dehydrogenase [Celeribacter halophilus]|uniref:Shikimate dehydrogenase (NADP(+)) n=1 Tax=Celeribacter halophilus TaxID=576117 RepID=A0A1I3TQ87_9RHOB|nr:shikimate dehydrogenase [Celeribacter halophilus]PZX10687.1 shikimate dehydrogenase [Celeribacter halophilus]SFJ72985.1 shikimate dehydrogenase [Celeribacter halophilus]
MSDKILLAGVIGAPIAHSKSPLLHGYWLSRYGIAGHYVPLHVEQMDLEEVLRMMPKMGFVGANVTIPHKETVLGLADIVTDRAALIGAANTLIFRSDGKLHADNTDGFGFVENLRCNADWKPEAGPAAVLGAGGASRAVIASLLEVGVPEIRLSNRTRARADALKDEFGAKISVVEWVHAGDMLKGARTVVNTTSLGMHGQPELKVSLDHLGSDAVVTDLVYTPLRTSFLTRAAEKGCQTVDGLGMLLYQAAPGFERWFGKRPEVDDATRQFILSA